MNYKTLASYLQERLGMLVIGEPNYWSVVNLIIGYELGISQNLHAEKNQLQEWFYKKAKKRFSVSWPFYILREHANDDEAKALTILITEFEAFANSLV